MISVIVPVYNASRWLGECIESVLRQSIAEWELIIVDDGSTDNSAEVAQAYACRDRRIRFFSIPNGGVSRARNFGIDNSRGEYLCFADADDCYTPHALELMLKALESRDTEMAVAQFRFAPANTLRDVRAVRWTTVSSREAMRLTLYQHPLWHTGPWARLFRRELFDAVRFVPGIRFEDLEIIPRLIARCRRVTVTTAQLYFYRSHGANFITTEGPGRKDALRAIDLFTRSVPEEWEECRRGIDSRRFSAAYNLLGYAARTGDNVAIARAWAIIKNLRCRMLTDGDVRLKNRLGALLSFAGLGISKKICAWTGR